MAPHSSTLAWKIPWTEEPRRLQSMESLELDTTEWLQFHFSLSRIGEGNGNPLQCSCLENPGDGEAWWAAVSGVAQRRTWLKQLSSSSSLLYGPILTIHDFWKNHSFEAQLHHLKTDPKISSPKGSCHNSMRQVCEVPGPSKVQMKWELLSCVPTSQFLRKKSKTMLHIITPTATSIPLWNNRFVCVPRWPCQGRGVKLRGHMPGGGRRDLAGRWETVPNPCLETSSLWCDFVNTRTLAGRLYLFARVAIKTGTTKQLKQEKRIISHIWRVESQTEVSAGHFLVASHAVGSLCVHSNLCLPPHMAFSFCGSLSSYKGIGHGLGPTLYHYDLILTNYICSNLISK